MVVGEEDGQTGDRSRSRSDNVNFVVGARHKKESATLLQHDSEGVKRESTKVHSAISGFGYQSCHLRNRNHILHSTFQLQRVRQQ